MVIQIPSPLPSQRQRTTTIDFELVTNQCWQQATRGHDIVRRMQAAQHFYATTFSSFVIATLGDQPQITVLVRADSVLGLYCPALASPCCFIMHSQNCDQKICESRVKRVIDGPGEQQSDPTHLQKQHVLHRQQQQQRRPIELCPPQHQPYVADPLRIGQSADSKGPSVRGSWCCLHYACAAQHTCSFCKLITASETLHVASYFDIHFPLTCCMLQEQQQHEQLPQLPSGILQQVLSHVPLQHRLGSCSLTSRAMHAAAVAATERLQGWADPDSQQEALELCQWLAKYGSQALRHLGVKARTWQQPLLSLALPSGLQQLQSLTKSWVELPAAVDSCVHPKLTSLCLERCVVRPCSDVFGWLAQQLVQLTGLQCLQLHSLTDPGTDPPKAGLLAFEEALGQLQQLTALGMKSRGSIDAALATLSSLSQLQQLYLEYFGTLDQPLQMQWLPSGLTSVRLLNCDLSCAAAGSGGSSSSFSWKLPVLKQLELGWVCGFDSALLQLREFSYAP
jgi:hypothetical protein